MILYRGGVHTHHALGCVRRHAGEIVLPRREKTNAPSSPHMALSHERVDAHHDAFVNFMSEFPGWLYKFEIGTIKRFKPYGT